MSLKYVAEPAICSDTLFSFLLYYNLDDADTLEHFINTKRRASDIKFFRDTVSRFEVPAEELYPFFAIHRTSSFAFAGIFNALCIKQECTIEQIEQYLPDAETLLGEVIRFYLPDYEGELSPAALRTALAELEAAPLVKFHLLCMAVDPQPYFERLHTAIRQRHAKVSAYYEANAEKLDKLKTYVREAKLREFLNVRYGACDEAVGEEITYSILLIGRNAVRYVPGDQAFMLLGSDCGVRIEQLMAETIRPDIVKVGKALSEEKRVMVLQLLQSREEITAQQLLRELELSMTATHYHLELLMQAGMLLTRNEGRTIYYSLNRRFFDTAPAIFEDYGTAAAKRR